jgi:hypothetical protein
LADEVQAAADAADAHLARCPGRTS